MLKHLLIDLHPLVIAIIGVSLHNVHEAISVCVLLLTAVYTLFKIYNDFFKPNKPK